MVTATSGTRITYIYLNWKDGEKKRKGFEILPAVDVFLMAPFPFRTHLNFQVRSTPKFSRFILMHGHQSTHHPTLLDVAAHESVTNVSQCRCCAAVLRLEPPAQFPGALHTQRLTMFVWCKTAAT